MEVARPEGQLHHRLLIENVDPMGAMWRLDHRRAGADLTDKEYQISATRRSLREIGVDTGGSNVQFAINPDDGRMIVIERIHACRAARRWHRRRPASDREDRAKLAVGYTPDELQNDHRRPDPASFEPTIDYVVKVPRFAFEKFKWPMIG
jgi:carbamoyl-phosphate synthase large subunit